MLCTEIKIPSYKGGILKGQRAKNMAIDPEPGNLAGILGNRRETL